MFKLYSASVCPFAQRTRALLTHLGAEFELVEVDLQDRDPELLRLSPTGKVPFLLDGDFALYESAVINEYLAERLNWDRAFPEDIRLRARHRVAMKQWDATIMPTAFYHALGSAGDISDEKLEEVGSELDALQKTVEESDGISLLSFHCAPFWARVTWLADHSPLPELVAERESLEEWLDKTIELQAVKATLPDREETVQQYEEHYVAA